MDADRVLALARRLRERVLPDLGSHAGREQTRVGASGDVTFAIDEAAEEELEQWVTEHEPGVAFYSEDRGLVEPSGAAHTVLVVDPIDGTRPAMAGFESSCVSIAAAPLGAGGEPTMADVEIGAIVEIKTGAHFLARRGAGVQASVPVRLSPNTDLDVLFWVYGFRARPVRVYAEVLGDLIDTASLRGGTFELGSATYDMTRVVTGQLDAYIEPGPLILERFPHTREDFLRVGGGTVLNNSPYDVAAAVLICREAGAVVTDCAGRPLDDRPLLGSGPEYQMSILACANAELHDLLVREVDRGLRRLG